MFMLDILYAYVCDGMCYCVHFILSLAVLLYFYIFYISQVINKDPGHTGDKTPKQNSNSHNNIISIGI